MLEGSFESMAEAQPGTRRIGRSTAFLDRTKRYLLIPLMKRVTHIALKSLTIIHSLRRLRGLLDLLTLTVCLGGIVTLVDNKVFWAVVVLAAPV